MDLDSTSVIHPRLERQRPAIAAAMALDDPTEITAALEDIQTLLWRCGYHLRFLRTEQVMKRKQRSRRAKRRGRPVGSANWASRQFALGLAEIWRSHTGRPPTRRHDPHSGSDHGPYHEFVGLVRNLLPSSLRRTRKGHAPSVDYLVRTGIGEFQDAQKSENEARRRGLIEEHRWMKSEDA
jgi:hypothetical protein